LIRMIMLQSALLADVLPRALSFKHTLQLWLATGDTLRHPNDDDNVAEFLALVAEQTIGNRPGRIEPRAIKRRPKPYPLLMQARTPAREMLRKYDHPKKLSKCHSGQSELSAVKHAESSL
ncbi:hypothetical protein SAMN04515620_1748, partial [Collimonas sp. OK607]